MYAAQHVNTIKELKAFIENISEETLILFYNAEGGDTLESGIDIVETTALIDANNRLYEHPDNLRGRIEPQPRTSYKEIEVVIIR